MRWCSSRLSNTSILAARLPRSDRVAGGADARSRAPVRRRQYGFLGGPAVPSNMAADSWVPRQFRQLSSRLVTQNGIMLMGGASSAVLLWCGHGSVGLLVVLYSINVFLTFSISLCGFAFTGGSDPPHPRNWLRRLLLSAWVLRARRRLGRAGGRQVCRRPVGHPRDHRRGHRIVSCHSPALRARRASRLRKIDEPVRAPRAGGGSCFADPELDPLTPTAVFSSARTAVSACTRCCGCSGCSPVVSRTSCS